MKPRATPLTLFMVFLLTAAGNTSIFARPETLRLASSNTVPNVSVSNAVGTSTTDASTPLAPPNQTLTQTGLEPLVFIWAASTISTTPKCRLGGMWMEMATSTSGGMLKVVQKWEPDIRYLR